jgi:hypothetical protein
MAETTIASRQIRDGAITDSKVAAGANIASSKLADGANFVKKDGSVAFTGNQSMGNNKLTSVATPTDSGDAANKSYIDNLINGLPSAYRYRNVKVATTTNVNLSNPATSTIDGISVSQGDRVLVHQQNTPSQNGIYVFDSSSTAMTRATDSDLWDELVGSLVYVDQGSTQGEYRYFCTSNSGGTLGSTAVTYTQDTSGTLAVTNFVIEETPSGSVNGSNTTFTLANTPTTGTLQVYLNGLRQKSGAGNDYTLSTNVISFTTAPIAGDVIIATYMK